MFLTRTRRLAAVLAATAIALVLAACDQEFSSTVKADGTVSGTWILADSVSAVQARADSNSVTYEEQLADDRTSMTNSQTGSFPAATVSDWADDDLVGTMATYTAISYDDFEAGVASAFYVDTPAEDVSLTKVNDRYVFGVVNLDPSMFGNANGQGGPIAVNRFQLTFPVPVLSSNGDVEGRTVSWDFVAHPDITTLVADTGKATVRVTGTFKKVGTAKVGKTVSIKAPQATTAGATRTYQWFAGTKKVKGATKPSLKLAKRLKGKALSVKVTYAKTDYYPFVKKTSFGKVK